VRPVVRGASRGRQTARGFPIVLGKHALGARQWSVPEHGIKDMPGSLDAGAVGGNGPFDASVGFEARFVARNCLCEDEEQGYRAKPAGSISGSNRANHVVSRQRPPDPLQLELPHWLDFHGVLYFYQHSRADEDLTRFGLVAEP
jgi:hypothetical protein